MAELTQDFLPNCQARDKTEIYFWHEAARSFSLWHTLQAEIPNHKLARAEHAIASHLIQLERKGYIKFDGDNATVEWMEPAKLRKKLIFEGFGDPIYDEAIAIVKNYCLFKVWFFMRSLDHSPYSNNNEVVLSTTT